MKFYHVINKIVKKSYITLIRYNKQMGIKVISIKSSQTNSRGQSSIMIVNVIQVIGINQYEPDPLKIFHVP